MPSQSKAQQRLAGMALSMKRGDTPKSKSKKAAEMAESMSEKELKEFAGSTEEEGNPYPKDEAPNKNWTKQQLVEYAKEKDIEVNKDAGKLEILRAIRASKKQNIEKGAKENFREFIKKRVQRANKQQS